MLVDGKEMSMADALRQRGEQLESGEPDPVEPEPEPEPIVDDIPLEPIPRAAAEPDPEPEPRITADPIDAENPLEGGTAEPYEPNMSFKVHDQEMEFDEFLRPLVTDPEAEKKVRDLLERAHGLDHVKRDRQTLRDDNQRLMAADKEFGEVKNDLQRLGSYLQNGDIQSFLEAHEIDDNAIFQYAQQKLSMQENPAMAQQYEAQRRSTLNQIDLEHQNQQLQAQNQNFMYQQKENELSYTLNDPSVKSAEQQYNQRMGEGAFRQEVVNRGQAHYRQTRQDLSARDAVNQVLQVMGFQPSQANVNQPVNQNFVPQPNGAQYQQAPMQGQQTGKPRVIPNLKGRSTTPVRAAPKSIQDLRNLSNELNG